MRTTYLSLVLFALVALALAPRPAYAAPGAKSAVSPGQTITVVVRGAVALVTVNRELRLPRTGELILDLALPERSALIDAQVDIGTGRKRLTPGAGTSARDGYLKAIGGMGIEAAEAVFDDDATHRLRIAATQKAPNEVARLTYSFSTPLDFSRDRYSIVFPAAPELTPPFSTRVEVRVEPRGNLTEVSIGGATHKLSRSGPARAIADVATRSRWLISLVPAPPSGARANRHRLEGRASVARLPTSGTSAVAYAMGVSPGAPQPVPERVLFVVDRSRSVAPAGLAAERDFAKLLLNKLPPSTRFDVLYFDRTHTRLFPVLRPATREAIQALDEQAVPALLANGTDVVGALRAAGDLIRREAATFGPSTLLVLLTDGALGRAPGGRLDAFLGATPGVALMTAVISLRPDDEPPVSTEERQLLRSLSAAAPLGGIEREVRVSEIGDAVPACLAALASGGDLYGVSLQSVGRPAPQVLAEVLAVSGGASGVVKTSGVQGAPVCVSVGAPGARRVATLPASTVPTDWLSPHVIRTPAERNGRLWVSTGAVAFLEWVVHAQPSEPVGAVRGYMERSVVRDALSLAFTPRARACYLNRRGATPAERSLSGRVRLALDLVRGEVGGARVESSTLARPDIEGCLRQAAFALDIPRAYRNDETVTAILNLVFRPRTPEKAATLDGTAVGEEIDLLVEEALKEDPPKAESP